MKGFPCHWPFVRGIHRSPVDSHHTGSVKRLWCFFYVSLYKRWTQAGQSLVIWEVMTYIWRQHNVNIPTGRSAMSRPPIEQHRLISLDVLGSTRSQICWNTSMLRGLESWQSFKWLCRLQGSVLASCVCVLSVQGLNLLYQMLTSRRAMSGK